MLATGQGFRQFPQHQFRKSLFGDRYASVE
jgi:hypothetical protein